MKKIRHLLFALLTIMCFQPSVKAQVTTSGLNGKITDSRGEVLPGVVVVAIHVPTGTKYPTMTDLNGVYRLVNLNSGGPYTIKATFIGQKDQVKENIQIALGENLKVNFTMQDNTQELQEVEVVANTDDNKKGTGSKVTKEQISQLPTLSRSITDFTRLTPQQTNNSFAGTNFRYNNISVDGAVNNDAIGFSPSYGGQGGTSNMPGSSTRNNPISLDAIQDMAVSIAPYDVKIGNFTGGSINAVTRRGTNNVEASVYGFFRNANLTGPDNSGDKSKMPSSYQDYQTGLRVGVPIVKDKLFFFTNFETTYHIEPLFYNAGDKGTFMTTAIAQQISDSLKSSTYMPVSQYNKGTYDPGASGAYNIFSKSVKFFARVDWNLNEKNQLSIRNNYVPSSASNLERDATTFQFGNYDFTQNNINNSTVLELKSQINNKTSNQFIAGLTYLHDYRTPSGTIFPQIQINNVNGSGVVVLGSNREASVFNQTSKTFEITDNFTWFAKKHTVTLGTHNEIYNINYGFVNSWNGRIDYNSLNDFINKKPARIRALYNLDNNDRDYNNNNPVAKFNVILLSAYAQDEYAAFDNLKLTLGVRVDYNGVTPSPARTPLIAATNPGSNYGTTFKYTPYNQFSNKALNLTIVSPRFGFTWDIANNKEYIIRGGSGIFTGRIPFAWFGYAFYNNGVNYGALDYKNSTPGKNIPTDPSQFAAYNTSMGQPNRVEVDLIDNNFKMPRVWRSNLATDLKLPGGVKLTLEGIFTQTIYDVIFKQINLKDSVKYAPIDVNHQQPIYLSGGPTANRVNNSFSSVYMMTNTSKGYRYQLTAQLSKDFKISPRHGVNVMAAYTYGQSRDVANGIRNSYESNWQVNQALNANNPTLAFSNFDIRHRIVSTVGYKADWNKKLTSYLSFVFTAQSGSPYTWVLNSNKITNSGQQVDLAYVPKDQSEINFVQFTDANGNVHTTQQQWNDLNAYISSDKYLNSRRGQYTERNGARTPWNNRLDLRFMQDINFYTKKDKKHTLQITFDIINFTNLLNPKWGYAYFVNNLINQSVSFGLTPLGTNGANGNPNYNYTTPTTTPYSIDRLNSRWQCQLGLRYSF